ncbi:hypothetical protein ColLi_11395 [Colletotrichum liriopes]|uniref:Uncharacterized protein n=1 Tax=Colletotrichum liriopes TaxID=708192 RepID=A0AA37LXQ4_9PEZI|nr:hypothetical protein ColLi_11395 [Colletotrichum liriopes]
MGFLRLLLTGHINNVMYNRYFETARVQFFRSHGQDATAEEKKEWEDLPTPRSLGLILKTITTEFKFPMKFPDRVHVLYKLSEPPTYETTSLRMEAWILSDQHRRIAARCTDETAIYDYGAGKKSVLKPFMVEKLQKTFEMQEETRKRVEEEARQVIAAVEGLEAQQRSRICKVVRPFAYSHSEPEFANRRKSPAEILALMDEGGMSHILCPSAWSRPAKYSPMPRPLNTNWLTTSHFGLAAVDLNSPVEAARELEH